MKQVFIKRGQVLVEEVPAPICDDNSLLIEVAYSLISSGTEAAGITRISAVPLGTSPETA